MHLDKVKPATWLLEFRKNVHSQSGEDGVLEKVLGLLPERDHWCVEIGAWDGRYLSNTRHLIESAGYSAILIEGDKRKAAGLRANYAQHKSVATLCAYVGFHERDSLDALLAAFPVPDDFDFLSVDIDGNDYHVWKAVTKYRPKIVCIEFNPTIPTEVRYVQPADPAVQRGASLLALAELGREKAYELVCVLPYNAIFVDARYFLLFEVQDNRPEALRVNQEFVTHIFSGYDGTVMLEGSKGLPWHRIPFKESRFQALPKWLRRGTGDYTYFQRLAYHAYLLLVAPSALFRKIRKKMGAS